MELHAYDKDTSKPTPAAYKEFKTTIRKGKGKWHDINDYFKVKKHPKIENWDFDWVDSIDTMYSGLLNNTNKPINVNVASRAWRKLRLTEPGEYEVKVQYGPKSSYTAKYLVVEPKKPKKKAKNVILFISDGTNVGMITAARALARKHTSGKYESLLSFEDFDNLGHVITNSVDSLLTDSANSASSYATGHKSSVSALGVYADSSASPFDDPKVELITELIRRRQPKKAIGIVSTAYGQDATPAAFTSHTRQRGKAAEITDQLLHGVGNWTNAGKYMVCWIRSRSDFANIIYSCPWCLVSWWCRILLWQQVSEPKQLFEQLQESRLQCCSQQEGFARQQEEAR